MINICPFCGRNISRVINSGITTCDNCQRVFSDSSENKMLAAAWYIIRNNVDYIDYISEMFCLDEKETEMVNKHIIEDNLGHDQFYKIVMKNK